MAYKESSTKCGNYDGGMPDSGYKLFAHCTFVNARDEYLTRPGVGISSSGGTMNLHFRNMYSYSDIGAIDFPDGALGYPHSFDHNWYGLRHEGFHPTPGSPWIDRWGLSRNADQQGEPSGGVRRYGTFLDWQQGKDVNGYHMPGYVAGVVPQTPVDSGLGGTWLHDPHSVYESRADHGLVSPETGDFSPMPGSAAIGLGEVLNTINRNCLPGWAAYEEAGIPTAGAVISGTYVPPETPVATSLHFTGVPAICVVNFPSLFTVEVLDAVGARFTSAPISITVAIKTGNGTLVGTLTRETVLGLATFDDLVFDTTQTSVVLEATAAGLTSADSSVFAVTPGQAPRVATSLRFTDSPVSATTWGACQFVVEVLDQDDLLYTEEAVPVTIALKVGSSGLLGTLVANSIQGVAAFTSVVFNSPGTGFIMEATSPGLVSGDCPAFDVIDIVIVPPEEQSTFAQVKIAVMDRIRGLTQAPQVAGYPGAAADMIVTGAQGFLVVVLRQGTTEEFTSLGAGSKTDRHVEFRIEVNMSCDLTLSGTAAEAQEAAFDQFLEDLCRSFRQSPSLYGRIAKMQLPQISPTASGYISYEDDVTMRYTVIIVVATTQERYGR
jgi:hypothetical protein